MKFILTFIWALIPPIVLAHSGATGVVKERMERFEQSKEEMKNKYDIESPGMADCLAMGEEMPGLKKKKVTRQFKSVF